MTPAQIKLIAGAVLALAAYLEIAKVVPPGLSAALGTAFGYLAGLYHPAPGKPQDPPQG